MPDQMHGMPGTGTSPTRASRSRHDESAPALTRPGHPAHERAATGGDDLIADLDLAPVLAAMVPHRQLDTLCAIVLLNSLTDVEAIRWGQQVLADVLADPSGMQRLFELTDARWRAGADPGCGRGIPPALRSTAPATVWQRLPRSAHRRHRTARRRRREARPPPGSPWTHPKGVPPQHGFRPPARSPRSASDVRGNPAPRGPAPG